MFDSIPAVHIATGATGTIQDSVTNYRGDVSYYFQSDDRAGHQGWFPSYKIQVLA